LRQSHWHIFNDGNKYDVWNYNDLKMLNGFPGEILKNKCEICASEEEWQP
jgi:hypothetical protein